VITITGLTHKQKALMDVMWSMEDMTNVQSFIKTLPTRDRQDCLSLIEIAVQETLEEDNRIDEYEELALNLISRVSSR
jgi:hypothetical protein